MKRSALKQNPLTRLKRALLKKVSTRQEIINECRALLLQIILIERGAKCQLCGRGGNKLHLFHILPTGKHPKLVLREMNVLISGWYCCHKPWHDLPASDPRWREIENKVKELRGVNYRNSLLIVEKTMPKMSMQYLNLKKFQLTQELKQLGEVKK